MKNIVFGFIIFLFGIFIFSKPASAHLPGQAPYFKINGVYSNLYPVLSASIDTLGLPQDIAPQPYILNEDVEFEIDRDKLPVPKEIVDATTFTWDFGDGSNGEGLKNTHAYKKIGSFVLTINAKTQDMPQAQIIQSVMVHVVPNKEYKLPQSIIKVNGRKSRDPITDTFHVRFNTDIEFDGSESKATGKIKEYFWDFGDTKTSTNSRDTHSYSENFPIVFPLLRIKDENGFISDSFVEIDNSKDAPVTTSQKNNNMVIVLAITGVLILLTGLFFIFKNKKNAK